MNNANYWDLISLWDFVRYVFTIHQSNIPAISFCDLVNEIDQERKNVRET